MVVPPTAATRPLRQVEETEHVPYPPPERRLAARGRCSPLSSLAGAVAGALLAYFLTRTDAAAHDRGHQDSTRHDAGTGHDGGEARYGHDLGEPGTSALPPDLPAARR